MAERDEASHKKKELHEKIVRRELQEKRKELLDSLTRHVRLIPKYRGLNNKTMREQLSKLVNELRENSQK